MWISPETTHVYRGRGRIPRCDRCGWQIEIGQRYTRYVCRPGRRRDGLYDMVEHEHMFNCVIDERDHEEHLTNAKAEVSVSFEMAYVAREVVVLSVDGKPFTETQFVLEPRPVPMTEVEPESYDCDSDEEIPL